MTTARPALRVSLQGKAGGTALSATLSGKGRPDAPGDATLSLTLSARNDDATALLALYGVPVLPLGMTGAGETDAVGSRARWRRARRRRPA